MKHFAIVFSTISIFLGFTAFSCAIKGGDYVFSLQNDSDMTIGWYIPSYEKFLEDSFPEQLPESLSNRYCHIKPGESHNFINAEIPYEYQSDDLLKIYIFDIETLYDYSWEQVVADKMYVHCFNLSASELVDNGKKIYFKGK